MKKILSWMLCLGIIMGATGTAFADMEERIMFTKRDSAIKDRFVQMAKEAETFKQPRTTIGDATFDGRIDAADALYALIYSVSLPLRDVPKTPLTALYENEYIEFYKKTPGWYREEEKKKKEIYFMTAYFIKNSTLMADVNNDCQIDAVDALYILQYAVGNRDDFPRTSFRGNEQYFKFLCWVDDWYPGRYEKKYDFEYNDLAWPPED